jgi:Tfp pilus assembly PilM family ATPase
MNWSIRPTWSPIGLRVSAQRVTAVQLDQIGRVRAFASFGRREPDSPISAAEAVRIRTVLDRQGFRGSSVVLGAPRRMIRSTTLELPPASSGAPIDQLADSELSRIHKLAPGTFTKGLWELPPSNRANATAQTMAVTCLHEHSDELCDLFEAADLGVVAIDVAALATIRALPDIAEGSHAILEIEDSRASLAVVHNGVLLFQRDLGEMTMRRLRAEVAKHLRLPASTVSALLHEQGLNPDGDGPAALAEAVKESLEVFIEEIAHSAAYASSRFANVNIARVFFVGPAAGIPGLAEHLGASLECAFTVPHICELTRQGCPFAEHARPGEGISALGLALWKAVAA